MDSSFTVMVDLDLRQANGKISQLEKQMEIDQDYIQELDNRNWFLSSMNKRLIENQANLHAALYELREKLELATSANRPLISNADNVLASLEQIWRTPDPCSIERLAEMSTRMEPSAQ